MCGIISVFSFSEAKSRSAREDKSMKFGLRSLKIVNDEEEKKKFKASSWISFNAIEKTTHWCLSLRRAGEGSKIKDWEKDFCFHLHTKTKFDFAKLVESNFHANWKCGKSFELIQVSERLFQFRVLFDLWWDSLTFDAFGAKLLLSFWFLKKTFK